VYIESRQRVAIPGPWCCRNIAESVDFPPDGEHTLQVDAFRALQSLCCRRQHILTKSAFVEIDAMSTRYRMSCFGSLCLLLGLFSASSPVLGQASGAHRVAWEKVTEAAEWQARDSSGELVFRNQIWIFGGWFDSFAAPPRDVWSSPDGKTWTQITREAPWKFSDLPMTTVFSDRMWLMGGWYNGRLEGHGATNEVWSSVDGKDWTQEKQAGWSPRIASGIVTFKDRMWILGGTENYYFGDLKSLRNDVWSTADGKTWKEETPAAGWSPRAYHQAVVHNDRIFVLGGGNYVPEYQATNDVWSSSDGIHWEQSVEHAPWSPRLWFSSVSWRDRIWVVGGWSNIPSKNWGDVWSSPDGVHWDKLEADPVWKERHEHSAYVFQDKLWVAGGHAQPLNSEVWSLSLPSDFFSRSAAP
jgi:hypothetical protein